MAKSKTKLFPMKVKEEKLLQYHEFARSKNLPLSEVIRRLLDNSPLPENVPVRKEPKREYTKVDPDLVFQLSAIGNNLNQIARRLNQKEKLDILPHLVAIENQLERLMDAYQVS
jgi:hypothetical protein